MKSALLSFILFISVYSFAQNFEQFRYTSSIFNSVDTLKNVEYATAPYLDNLIDEIPQLADLNVHDGEETTETRPLYMDIYKPANDTVLNRPAVLFVHGGGFLIGTKENEDMVALCDSFARMGYVTASIQYRLGVGSTVTRNFGIITNIDVSPDNFSRSVYRGIQDGKAAVRFLKANADIYGIDSSKVFMSGSSAGAFVTLHNNYMDKDSEIPEGALGEPLLGGIDAIGVSNVSSKVNAIAPFWGALESTDLIENDQTPSLLIHGTEDEVVLFKDGKPLQSMVPPNPLITFDVPITYGSFCIDTALNNREVQHETYFVEGANHEFYGVNNGAFPEDGPNAYWDTVFTKVNTFFNDQHKPHAEFEYVVDDLSVSFISGEEDIIAYQWSFGDGEFSNEVFPEHEYTQAGTYEVELIVQNDIYAWDSYKIELTVGGASGLYNVSFQVNINDAPIEGAQLSLADYGIKNTNVDGFVEFNEIIGGDSIPFVLDNFSGWATYNDTIYSLISDTLIVLDFYEVGFDNAPALINLYPNPNNGSFNLELNRNALVEIYNTAGQIMHYEHLAAGLSTIDLESACQGIYFVKVISLNEVNSYKVIVE